MPTYLPATRYGGPIYSVHGLCKALASQGHEVHVFTTNVDGEEDSVVPIGAPLDIDGVKVSYFPSHSLRRLYYSPLMMGALREKVRDFDVVHLHSIFLWPTWAAARMARWASVPYVLSPRGMLVRELINRKSRWVKTAWLSTIEKKNIERASAIHVTSCSEESALADFPFRFPAVFNVPNGIEVPGAWSGNDLAGDVKEVIDAGPYVLYFGRINWKKGIDRLLRAWAHVPGWRLVIAGNDEEGYASELKRLAAGSGVLGRVQFLTRAISGADKEGLLASATLLVLASYSENFGNVVPEAMVRGVPVVVTEEVGARDIVDRSGGGVVVNANELAASINALLQDEAWQEAAAQSGKEWVKKHLLWEGVAGRMCSIYESVVS